MNLSLSDAPNELGLDTASLTSTDLDGHRIVPPDLHWSTQAKDFALSVFHDVLQRQPTLLAQPVGLPLPRNAPKMPMENLKLSVRSSNCLRKAGVLDLNDLVHLTWGDLLDLRSLGERSLLEIVCTVESVSSTLSAEEARKSGFVDLLSDVIGTETAAMIESSPQTLAQFAAMDLQRLLEATTSILAVRTSLEIGTILLEYDHPGTAESIGAIENWAEDPIGAGSLIAEQFERVVAARISTRTQTVIKRRFGLHSDVAETLQSIANDLDLSRERVRQLQEKSLKHLHAEVWRDAQARAIFRATGGVARDGESLERWLELSQDVWPGSAPETARLLYVLTADSAPHSASTQWQVKTDTWRNADKARQAEQALQRRASERANRMTQKLEELIATSWWPKDIATSWPSQLQERAREPDPSSSTYLETMSMTLDRYVLCDSALERSFFELCDISYDVIRYLEQPAAIPYVFEGRNHLYYPDALLQLGDGRIVLVEVKTLGHMIFSQDRAKWRGAWDWCKENGVGLLVTDTRRTLKAVIEDSPRQDLGLAIRERIRTGTITWKHIRELRSTLSFSTQELVNIVYAEGLICDPSPWALRSQT